MMKPWLTLKGVATLARRHWLTDLPAGSVRRVLSSRESAARRYGWDQDPMAVAVLKSGHVVAQPAAVVGQDGSLLWAFAPQLTRTPLTATAIWRRPSVARPLSGKTLFAAVDGFSYYHWLLGTLPKLIAASRTHRLDDFAHVVVNPRHKGARNFQIETLEILGIDPKRVVWLERGTHVVSDELYLPPEPGNRAQTEIAPWALEAVRDLLLPLAAGQPEGPKKIFVSRATARRRKLINETEVIAALAPQGFEPVVLESLPLLTQVKWFSEATHVVGLHGAGLANLVFCSPGLQLVELLPTVWPNPCFEHLATAISAHYARIPTAGVGPRRGFGQDQVLGRDALPALQNQLSL
jgi:capsular polysaccharide biosynthesis protein